ncbi:aminoacyl-tRNA deacylase [Propionibacterium freudenreichii]|uniref:aminoacyl-tRNA deacylase n=1 Tax=Propionibacterium freudenreichii TaxID=1744 RepID=UPI000BC3319B|nr:aminoacyl-tRNA deacylase [Propionibacterium freudenreichii]SBN43888.1 Cys-tRNA(Pro)/Cys-tRNA(Cys) deacylase ybaK [Propionibacterium freudenreichii]
MSKSANKSTGTPATVALARTGLPHTLHPYVHDPRSRYFGEEAAAALHVDPARVFKTLVVELTSGPEPLVTAVIPADNHLDLKQIAALSKAKRVTGFVRGGISPLGQKRQTPVIIDQSAAAAPTIFVSGGRRGLSVEMAPDDLVRATHGRLGTISRPGLHWS